MPDAPVELDELVDLKMLPAWVSEPMPSERYAQHQGEDQREGRGYRRREERGQKRKRSGPNFQPASAGDGLRRGERPTSKADENKIGGDRLPRDRFDARKPKRERRDRPAFAKRQSGSDLQRGKHRKDRQHRPAEKPLPPIVVRFLPRVAAFENVVAQIKSGSVAYSLFALARLFLEKATRHDVQLTAPPDSSLFQLGENSIVSVDRQFLERNAFRFAQADFYEINITETEPIKGSFTNVAHCRLSGTWLGPTNHHDYQRRLRNLYEQRFSRRMSFADYQRRIQIVTDPAEIEKWKEDARKVTTYSTLRDEPPVTFSSATEAERHFQQHYLPGLVRTVSELVIDGPASRRLHDRVLNRLIEKEWSRETRSPSPMMQELAARFRDVGLHVFRHRRGMLFVSPIYPRAFRHDETAVSPQVRTILEAIGSAPRIGRKELADKLIVDVEKPVEAAVPGAPEPGEGGSVTNYSERTKMALASDLKWLISEGYVIEFNDGSLDLPRAKAKPKENVEAAVSAAEKEERVEAGAPPADESPVQDRQGAEVGAIDPIARGRFGEPPLPTEHEAEIGGS